MSGVLETPEQLQRELKELRARVKQLEAERVAAPDAVRLEHHIRNTPLAVIEWGHDLRVTRWSERAEEIFGWSEAEVVGKNIDELGMVHPEDHEGVQQAGQDLLSGRVTAHRAQNRNLRNDGSVIHCEWFNSAVRNESGELLSLLSFVQDVTARTATELSLLRSEQRLRAIIKDQTDFIVRWKPDGVRTFVNDSYCSFFGITADEAIGTSFFPLIKPEDLQAVQDRLSQLTPAAPVSTATHRSVTSEGQVVWTEWTDRALFDAEGQLIEYQSVGRDVTHFKLAESSLRRSESRFELAVRGSLDGIWDWDLQTDVVFWSPRFFEQLGFVDGEFTPTMDLLYDLLHADFRERVREAISEAQQTGGQFAVDVLLRHNSGNYRWYAFTGAASKPGPSAERMAGSLEDIHTRKKAAQQLRNRERQLSLVTDALPVLIAYLDHEHRYRYVNAACRRWWEQGIGILAPDVLGKTVREAIGSAHYEQLLPYLDRVRSGETFSFETDFLTRNGETRHRQVTFAPHLSDDGSYLGYYVLAADVTEQFRAEEESRRAREAMQLVLEGTARSTGTDFLKSLVTNLAAALGVRYVELSSVTPDGTEAQTLAFWANGGLTDNVAYDIRDSPFERLIHSRETCVFPRAVQREFPHDKTLREMEVESFVGTSLVGAGEQVLGVLAAMHDEPMEDTAELHAILEIFADRAAAEIERIQSEAALRMSEDRHRGFVETSTEGIFLFEFETPIPVDLPEAEQIREIAESATIVVCNDAFGAMYGYASGDAMIGMRAIDLFGTHDNETNTEFLSQLIRSGYRIQEAVTEEVAKDGSRVVFANNCLGIVEEGLLLRVWGTQRDITEQRQALVALEASENRFRQMVEHAPEAIVIYDVETGRLIDGNPAAAELFGMDVEELTRHGPGELSPPVQPDGRTSEEAAGHYLGLAVQGETPVFEWTHRDASGRDIPCEVRLLRLELDGRTVVRGSVTDISDRKAAQQALRDSEILFRSAFEDAATPMVLQDPDGNYTRVNHAFCELLGYPQEEILARNHADFTHPDDLDRPAEIGLVREGLTQRRLNYEKRYLRSDGCVLHTLVSSSLVHHDDGSPLYRVVQVQDITALKEAQKALQVREASFRNLVENMNDVVYRTEVKPEPHVTYISPSVERLSGYTPEEFYAQPELGRSLIHPDDVHLYAQLFEGAGQDEPAAVRWIRKDGQVIWTELRQVYIYGDDGELEAIEGVARDVTRRREAEEALRESQARFRLAFNQQFQFMALLDPEGTVLEINDLALRVHESEAAEWVGRKFSEGPAWASLPGWPEIIRSRVEDACQSDGPVVVEDQYQLANGLVRYADAVYSAVRDDSGEVQFVIVQATDITDRKVAERALQASQERLRLAVEAARIGTWNWLLTTDTVVWDAQTAEIFAFPADAEMCFATFEASIHVDDRANVMHDIEAALAGIRDYDTEFRAVRPDGSVRFLAAKGAVFREAERPARMTGVVMDITARRQAEQDLRETKAILSAAIEASPAGIIIADAPDLRIRALNTAAIGVDEDAEWSRDEPPDLFGDDTFFSSPDGTPLELDELPLARAIRDGEVSTNVDVLVRREGSNLRWTLANAAPVRNEDGTIVAGVVVFLDVTELKQTHEALQDLNRRLEQRVEARTAELSAALARIEASEQKYRTLVEHLADEYVMYSVNPDGTCQYVSDSFLRLFGLQASDVLGRDWLELLDRLFEESDAARESFRCCVRGEQPELFEVTVIDSAGERQAYDMHDRPVFDADGRVAAMSGIGRNITAFRTAEMLLRQARDRAEAADRVKSAFLATMSHELRTPLNSIIGFTGILLQGLVGDLTEEQDKQLRIVQRSARHLLGLINDILDISKIEAEQLPVKLAEFDAGESVLKVVEMTGSQAQEKGLHLEAFHAEKLGAITSDRRRFEQVLLNLLGNAVKFTETGGVTVRCVRATDQIRVEVADTGPGIREEDLTRLFHPFRQLDSTISRKHEGTGLGLAIARRLAQLLQGDILVESTFGEGSVFTLVLPLMLRPEDVPRSAVEDLPRALPSE